MELRKKASIILIFGVCLCFILLKAQSVEAKSAIPENPVAVCKNAHSIKLKWNKVSGVTGYRVYRYNRKRKKYTKVKTINDKNKIRWVDKNLKAHKVYKYKIASFKKRKKGIKFSKKTYSVTARTYGKNGKIVNADSIYAELSAGKDIGICANGKINTVIFGDSGIRTLNTRLVSKKIVWKSSDKTIATVDQNGNVTTFQKSGICDITMRLHNGKIKKYKLKVVNYANPKSFPYYDGDISEINDLLINYKDEICRIATFFTIHGKENVRGTISADDKGEITGIPKLEHIEGINVSIQKLMEKYSLPIDIFYNGKGYVEFRVFFGKTHYDITYSENNSFKTSPLRIASHWMGKSCIV